MTKLTGKVLSELRKAAEPYKGVYVEASNATNPFRARFYYNGTNMSLGYYDNPTDAALAYNKKAKTIYGGAKNARKANKWNEVS